MSDYKQAIRIQLPVYDADGNYCPRAGDTVLTINGTPFTLTNVTTLVLILCKTRTPVGHSVHILRKRLNEYKEKQKDNARLDFFAGFPTR